MELTQLVTYISIKVNLQLVKAFPMSLLNLAPKTLEDRYFQEIRLELYELHGKHQQHGARKSHTS